MQLNQSFDFTKEKTTETESGQQNDFIELPTMRNSVVEHKRYGNMVVFLQTDRILITLGPDYMFFVITFTVFGIAGFFLTSIVNQAFNKTWVKVLNILIVLIQQLSYLMVGLSNPGVTLQQNIPSYETNDQDQQHRKKNCSKCKIRVQQGMRHCKRCDVCIRGYDHHCPWVSKCIGASNIKRFYFFVTFTPFYILYFMTMLSIGLALNFQKQTLI